MAKKRKAKRAAGPKCGLCEGTMTVKRIIPAAHIFPELRTYQCDGCGILRTVEDEAELFASEAGSVAA